ncbi:cupin domain-containing protein [bacterium]|nr:cupin domain-containing protein [bacterium]
MNEQARRLVEALGLAPHPEGGWYRETWRSAVSVPGPDGSPRAAGTSIYYLLAAGAASRLHRLAADEVWHHHQGDPVDLHLFAATGHRRLRLGDGRSEAPAWQAVVPAGTDFGAEVAAPGGWALLGCTLAPGFSPADFAWSDVAALSRRHPAAADVLARLR